MGQCDRNTLSGLRNSGARSTITFALSSRSCCSARMRYMPIQLWEPFALLHIDWFSIRLVCSFRALRGAHKVFFIAVNVCFRAQRKATQRSVEKTHRVFQLLNLKKLMKRFMAGNLPNSHTFDQINRLTHVCPPISLTSNEPFCLSRSIGWVFHAVAVGLGFFSPLFSIFVVFEQFECAQISCNEVVARSKATKSVFGLAVAQLNHIALALSNKRRRLL